MRMNDNNNIRNTNTINKNDKKGNNVELSVKNKIKEGTNYEALDSILSLLDPTSSLDITNVMDAYDQLITLLSSYSSPSPPSSLLLLAKKKDDEKDTDTTEETVTIKSNNSIEEDEIIHEKGDSANSVLTHYKQKHDELKCRIAYWADVCRALLLSSYLLLEMLPEQQSHSHQKRRKILHQSIKRCILLLKSLSYFHKQFVLVENEKKEEDCDWHDVNLPCSRYQLLQECFTNGKDGRVVPLDETFYIDEEENEGYNVAVETIDENSFKEDGKNNGSSRINYVEYRDGACQNNAHDVKEETEDDGNDEFDLNMDIKEIQAEEEKLLNIALPSSASAVDPASCTKNKKRKGGNKTDYKKKHQKNNDNFSTSSVTKSPSTTAMAVQQKEVAPKNKPIAMKSIIQREGFLIFVNDYENDSGGTKEDQNKNQIMTTTTISTDEQIATIARRQKCMVRLLHCGIIMIEIMPTSTPNKDEHKCADNDKLNEKEIVYDGTRNEFYIYSFSHISTCQPILYKSSQNDDETNNDHDKTFHFELNNVHRLKYHPANDKNTSGVDTWIRQCYSKNTHDISSSSSKRLVFSVDEASGGSLMDGYHWVNALTKMISNLSERKGHFRQIKKEWGEKEWNTSVEALQKTLSV